MLAVSLFESSGFYFVRIDLENMSDVSAKADTTLRISIPILKTHPIPTAEWTLNGKPIEGATVEVSITLISVIASMFNCLFMLQVTETEALLTIPKCKRAHTGRYAVTLTNSSGSTEATVKATVLGMLVS